MGRAGRRGRAAARQQGGRARRESLAHHRGDHRHRAEARAAAIRTCRSRFRCSTTTSCREQTSPTSATSPCLRAERHDGRLNAVFPDIRIRGFGTGIDEQGVRAVRRVSSIDGVAYSALAYFSAAALRPRARRGAARPAGHALRQEHDRRPLQRDHEGSDRRATPGSLDLQLGELDRRRVEAAVGGPVIEGLRELPRRRALFDTRRVRREHDGGGRSRRARRLRASRATRSGFALAFPGPARFELKLSYDRFDIDAIGVGAEFALVPESTRPLFLALRSAHRLRARQRDRLGRSPRRLASTSRTRSPPTGATDLGELERRRWSRDIRCCESARRPRHRLQSGAGRRHHAPGTTTSRPPPSSGSTSPELAGLFGLEETLRLRCRHERPDRRRLLPAPTDPRQLPHARRRPGAARARFVLQELPPITVHADSSDRRRPGLTRSADAPLRSERERDRRLRSDELAFPAEIGRCCSASACRKRRRSGLDAHVRHADAP